jgi:mannose-6-phosphate isomerase-like protein (cupin superfamily)
MKSVESGRFDTNAVAAEFPLTAETMLLDRYLTDSEGSSTRIFRVYRATPAHHHAKSDEHLLVLSGRGVFWMDDPSTKAECGPGHLLVFKRGTVHAMPQILEEPLVLLAIDAPRRDPEDVIFENPAEGTAKGFIRQS